MNKTLMFFILGHLITTNVGAQQTVFNQALASSFLYNPALTGSTGQTRIVSVNKTQSRVLFPQPNFQTFLAYDQFVENWGAIGGAILYSQTGSSLQINSGRYYSIQIAYAPKFTIAKSITISPGIRFEYHHITQEFLVLNRVSQTNGFLYEEITESGQGIDISSGISLNSKKVLVGLGFNQLYHPVLHGDDRLQYEIPFTFTGQFAYRTRVKLKNKSYLNITPGYFIYSNKMLKSYNLKLLLDYQFYALGGGIDLSNRSPFLNIGFLHRYVKIGYTFQPVIDKPGLSTPAIHEFSLQFAFNYKKGDKHDGFELNKIHSEE